MPEGRDGKGSFPQEVRIKYKQGTTSVVDSGVAEKVKRLILDSSVFLGCYIQCR